METLTLETYKPTPRQAEAHKSFARYVLYGGAVGGGKTRWLVEEINMLCLEYPGNRGFLGRKRGSDLKISTLLTFKQFIPSELYTINEHKKEIQYINGSLIIFGGLDDEMNIEKLKSTEFGFIAIDQVEELTRDDFDMGCTRLRHILPNGTRPRYRGLYTANPAPTWVKEVFILNPSRDHAFIQALPKDNPYNPPDYEMKLRQIYEHRPELMRAYVEGNWDELEGSDIIVQHSWVVRAVKRPLHPLATKRIVVCDPARFGDDETVIYVMKNEQIIDELIYGKRDTMETAGHLISLRNKYQASLVAVDVIGIGAGIADRLKEILKGQPLNKQTFKIEEINSAMKSSDPERFKNVRAEMWWNASEVFYQNKTSIPDDVRLIGQISAVKYKPISSGQIWVEPKDEVKKRIGTSPDRADAYIMGLYALRFARPMGQMATGITPVRQVQTNAGIGF